MYIFQSLFSTTAGAVMVLAILVILMATCVAMGVILVKKTNKLYYYEDMSTTAAILESQLKLARDQADQYDSLSYLLFRVLYELIGESESTTSIHRLTVLRSSHLLLDTDLREGAQTIMKNIKSGDPDTESIIQYIMSIMDVFNGYQVMSSLGQLDYREMTRSIIELQETISSDTSHLSTLYDKTIEEREEYHQSESTPDKHSFLEWFKVLVGGLKHPNNYYGEDDEDEDDK